MNITIVGGGNMARALLGGLIARGHGSHALTVVEIDPEARATVSARFGVATFAALEPPAVVNADVIVIAVKPQNVRAVARELATLLKRQVVVTIAAGIRLSDLSRWLLGYRRLVRAMPNTPALIGAGIAGLYALPGVDSEGRTRAADVLEAVGATLWCEREEELDAVTAVSGSGPAYVFYFLEALEAAAREVGFTPADARRLALATFSGAVRLAEQSDSEVAVLRAQVTSKGGTTERALATLDEARVKAAVAAAVKAAAERAKELGERFGSET
ncbi:MAG: pyrroline-5-carboxylate reductase [Betaproteobacteria bacterium]|nr:MAG: pyrroline-5-carboxylate reductase [Betaproteobacteria bacterium]